MLDPATDVDLAAGASVSVANVSVASTSVASFSGCQCLSCQCLSCQCRAMVAEDITKPVAEDSCETISRIPMSHQQRCPVSRPSSPQKTTDQVTCNTKNVMKI